MSFLCELGISLFCATVPVADLPQKLPENDKSAWESGLKKTEEVKLVEPVKQIKLKTSNNIQKSVEIPKEIEKIIYVDKPVEVIREIPVEKQVLVYPEPAPIPDFYTERLANIDYWNDDLVEIKPNNNIQGKSPTQGEIEKSANLKQSKYTSPSDKSSNPVNNDNIVTQDRYINGILENTINSQIAGTIIVQIAQNVYGYHGRNILIPKGSRMVCSYETAGEQGVSRLQAKCNRILMGETRAEINQIDSSISDVQGAVGIAGEVDNRFYEKYGLAFGLAAISVGTRIGTATIANKGSSGNNQGTNNTSPINQAVDDGAKELSQKFGEISAQSLQESLAIKPIIRVSKGTRIQIRPAKDWIITTN